MLKGATLFAAVSFLWASAAQAAEPAPRYALAWGNKSAASKTMVEQTDRQLRAELAKRGVLVVTQGRTAERAIVLMPKLDVSPDAISLSLVKVGADRALVGEVQAKVAGPHRDAKLKALVERAVDEAARL